MKGEAAILTVDVSCYFLPYSYDSTSYGDNSAPTSATYDSSVPPSAGYDSGVPQSAGYNSVPQSAGYDSIHSNSSGAERVSAYSATDYEIQQMVNGQQVSSVPQGEICKSIDQPKGTQNKRNGQVENLRFQNSLLFQFFNRYLDHFTKLARFCIIL